MSPSRPETAILGFLAGHLARFTIGTLTNSICWYFKVAYTSGQIFVKIMKRYPIFSVQIINYQIDQKHK